MGFGTGMEKRSGYDVRAVNGDRRVAVAVNATVSLSSLVYCRRRTARQ